MQPLVIISKVSPSISNAFVQLPAVVRQTARNSPSNQPVLIVQRKNCEPLVPGPALAMDKTPAHQFEVTQASGNCWQHRPLHLASSSGPHADAE